MDLAVHSPQLGFMYILVMRMSVSIVEGAPMDKGVNSHQQESISMDMEMVSADGVVPNQPTDVLAKAVPSLLVVNMSSDITVREQCCIFSSFQIGNITVR